MKCCVESKTRRQRKWRTHGCRKTRDGADTLAENLDERLPKKDVIRTVCDDKVVETIDGVRFK